MPPRKGLGRGHDTGVGFEDDGVCVGAPGINS